MNLHGVLQNTTASMNSANTNPTSTDNDWDEFKKILPYVIPVSCAMILMLVILVIGIPRRKLVLQKWNSLKRMRNTNPTVLERVGLRRDSEYDSSNRDFVSVTVIDDKISSERQTQYHLATIS